MKTNHFTTLFSAILGLAAFSNAGCAEKKEKLSEAAMPLAPDVATTKTTVTPPAPTAAAPTAPAVTPAPAAQWSDIENDTYDTRAHFFPGLNQLEARVDAQVTELTAIRAAMKSTINTKDWDFAMKEMEDARIYLKSTGEDLGKANPETWDQLKEKVGQAWARTQAAYDKVKTSTTG